jgi:hypothetical protein
MTDTFPTDLTTEQTVALFELLDLESWALDVAKIRLPKTGALDLKGHPYLRAIYGDMSPEIVLMKGAQLGMSTAAMVRAFWMLTTFPSTVIYTMPTVGFVSQHTASRINPIITQSAYLQDRIVNVDSVAQKQFVVAPGAGSSVNGDLPRSTIYFRGATTDKDAVSVDADMLIHDEEDISDPSVIEQFESRLDASNFRWKFRLSTPRLPGTGIDRVFQATDRRRWLIRCSGCNADFEMAFPGGPWDYGNIEPDPSDWGPIQWSRWEQDGMVARYVCHRCGKTVTHEDRMNGRWVAEYPGRSAHGYAVSQMAAPWISAERVLYRRMKATWEAHFWNLVMGIPWQSESMGMSRVQLIGGSDDAGLTDPSRRRLEAPQPGRHYHMGVDPGQVHDWVIDESIEGTWRTVAFGTASDWDELDRVTKLWMPRRVVVDGAFDPTACRDYADRWNSKRYARVWLCFYSRSSRNPLSWDRDRASVTVDRTDHLSRYADARAASPGSLPRWDETPVYERWVTHHVNSKKVPVWVKGLESQRVLDHYEWVEIGADHQFHASAYAMLAREIPSPPPAPPLRILSCKRATGMVRQPRAAGAARRRRAGAIG